MPHWKAVHHRFTMECLGRQVVHKPLMELPCKHLYVTPYSRHGCAYPDLCSGYVSASKVNANDNTENLSYCILKRRGSTLLLYRNDPQTIHVDFPKCYSLWTMEGAPNEADSTA